MKYPILAVAAAWAILLLILFAATGAIDLGSILRPVLGFFEGPIPAAGYGAAALAIVGAAAWSAVARGGSR